MALVLHVSVKSLIQSCFFFCGLYQYEWKKGKKGAKQEIIQDICYWYDMSIPNKFPDWEKKKKIKNPHYIEERKKCNKKTICVYSLRNLTPQTD